MAIEIKLSESLGGFFHSCCWFSLWVLIYLWILIYHFGSCKFWFLGFDELKSVRLNFPWILIQIESVLLELLQWTQLLHARAISFLNSLEIMLTNKIVWKWVLFKKKKKNPVEIKADGFKRLQHVRIFFFSFFLK